LNEVMDPGDRKCYHWSDKVAYKDRLCPDGEYWKKDDELCAIQGEELCIRYCSQCGACEHTLDNESAKTSYEHHLLYKRALARSALQRYREEKKHKGEL